jgi:phosphoglycerate dehydrogenase-like enzyme
VTTICVPSPTARESLGEVPAGVTVLVWDGSGEPPTGIADVQFLLGAYMGPVFGSEAIAMMPRLEVIQLMSAGVDSWLPVVPDSVVLCNGRGVHGASTAELALAGMLALLRRIPQFVGDQAAHAWAGARTDDLDGKRLLILGAGDIGRRVAAAAAVFGAESTLIARTAREGVRPLADVPTLLPEHDIVLVALPHTAQTHHLVDAGFLAAMPDSSMLVNVARGGIVDTAALLAELTAQRLYAFLDVTDPEPLPPDHPLWAAPNLLITPHVGGGTLGWPRRAYALVRTQLRRFVAGEPLVNVVADGY